MPNAPRGGEESFTWIPYLDGGSRLPAPVGPEYITAAVSAVLDAAARSDVAYLGPGAPLGDDPVATALARMCRESSVEFELIEAAPLWWAIRPLSGSYSVIGPDDVGVADLAQPSLVTGLVGRADVRRVQIAARARSPNLRLTVSAWGADPVEAATDADDVSTRLLSAIHPCAMHIPAVEAMNDRGSIRSLLEIVAQLRAPDGCPWDREQTHESLRRYMIEEAYEAVEAIDDGRGELADELGDVLVQVALHSQIAAESGEFDFSDVVASITGKLIRRHTHVFGDITVDGVDEVLTNWERIKAAERGDGDFLAGVPSTLPSLLYAREALARAGRLKFESDTPQWADDVLSSLENSLKLANGAEREAALGVFLLGLVRAADALDLDPELALASENRRFRQRVTRAIEAGENPADA